MLVKAGDIIEEISEEALTFYTKFKRSCTGQESSAVIVANAVVTLGQ